ncbi:MAG TPA: hypothetical protein VLQ80_05785, partial [Candidatus Saccharimonadia bacterium]|nr:hypothetical protein [Candidatus Saccharimonadia bacterium]
LTPRRLGIPPRLQPTVLGPDIFQWLYCQVPKLDAGEDVAVLSIPAALQILQHTVDDPEEQEGVRERAAQLRAWLQEQVED